MAGVFISKGMGFRIPAGGLTIEVGEDGEAKMSLSRVEVNLDFWDHWLEIARDRAIEAMLLRKYMLAARKEGDEDQVGELFGQMLRTSMTCMSAAGFSLDALYSSVKERLPDGLLAGIGSPTAARHQFVHETLRRAARLSNNQVKFAKSVIKQIFSFRDSAVHPPGGWSEPILHPDLGVAMATGYIAFRAENAAKGYAASRRVIESILSNARPDYSELAEWANGALQRLPDALPPEIAIVKWDDYQEPSEESTGSSKTGETLS